MSFLPLDTLRDGAMELGVGLSEAQLGSFDRFSQMLVETNRQFNLTRITEPEAIVTSHILDSLLCLQAVDVKKGARVVDVGSGAGFPGIPLKIARPDIHITLLESTGKKVGFLSEVIGELGFEQAEAIHGRAEELAQEKEHREGYDIACARALSELKVLAELCLPLIAPAGRVVAYKSADITEEIESARPMVGQLGGSIEKTFRAKIPGTDIHRSMVVLLKTHQTPERFPRAYAQMTKAARK